MTNKIMPFDINYTKLLISKYNYAPYIFVFYNPKSKLWNVLKQVCEQHMSVVMEENNNIICFFTPATKEDYIVLNNVVQAVKTWKTAYLFIDGVLQDFKNLKWLECFNKSLNAEHIYSYCTRIDRTVLNNEWHKIILPCKMLRSTAMWMDDRHPSPFKEQLQARAVGICELCPNLNMENFKILEKEEDIMSPWQKVFNTDTDEEDKNKKTNIFKKIYKFFKQEKE